MAEMKIVLFAYNPDPVCFVHVLLNALHLHERGEKVRIVMEGEATRLVRELGPGSAHPLAEMWGRAREARLLGGVCRACASRFGALESAGAQNLPLLDDMSGHPSIAQWVQAGWQVVNF